MWALQYMWALQRQHICSAATAGRAVIQYRESDVSFAKDNRVDGQLFFVTQPNAQNQRLAL